MEYKILESNGVEIENIDGAALNNLITGSRSGIVANVGNNCNLITQANVLTIDTGLILVSGFRVKILKPKDFALTGNPAYTTDYQLILQITLNKDRRVIGDLYVREKQVLTQDNLFVAEQGVYQFEIATFKHNVDGTISSVQKSKLLTNSSDFFEVDGELSSSSKNPVQNKVVTESLKGKLDKYNGDGVNYYLYAVDKSGTQKNILYNIGPVPNSIVGRNENGLFTVKLPTESGNPTPKHYVDTLFNGANKAIVFNDYPSMFTGLKAQSKDKYSIGQNVFIIQLGVPDLWISGIEETFNDAIYGDDENFIEFLNQHGSVHIGYYRLSALETQKVDLLDYYDKDELDSMFRDKLDKKTDSQPFTRLYAVNENGEQTMLNVSNSITYLTIPVRDENGTFDVLYPQGDNNPVPLGYFNEKVDKKIEEAIDGIEIPEPEIVIKGENAPTNETVGKLGSFYFDTTNNNTYQCVEVDTETTSYTWVKMIRETDLSNDKYLAGYRYNESNGLYTLKAGLLKYEPPQYSGLFKSTAGGVGSGALRIKSAQHIDIDSRKPTDYHDTGVSGANKCLPIVPANLDYAVFAVLTNPKITLTDEQKATIRANLGIE